MSQMNVLVLGASYGLLPAVRILLAGHRVTVVCRSAEQSALTAGGASISFLNRSGEIGSRLSAAATCAPGAAEELVVCGTDIDVGGFDIVFFAMSEPQFADGGVAALCRRISRARLPVVTLMNALPPPFLARLDAFDIGLLRPAYSSWEVWEDFDPMLVTAASPDAQAVRAFPDRPNELTVTLASNFKVAPFAGPDHQALLDRIARDVSAYRPGGRPLPVRILAYTSLHVPLAKWPMLIAGNCRCLQADGSIISIGEAVGRDLETSSRIYNRVVEILFAAGAKEQGVVPFEHYAKAARSLTRPSSLARALVSGAPNVERVDRMVQLCGRALDIAVPELDLIVESVDCKLASNRQ